MQPRPTERFSDRAAYYVRSRPTYPRSIVKFFAAEFSFSPEKLVADIGSGTGLLTRIFLDNGNRVFGVEPNPEMRGEGERFLAGYPHFTSINGTAEATTLPPASVDAVVAGQAFHWFDPPAAQIEFQRIARPDAFCALIWNKRDSTPNSFDADYDRIVHDYTVDPAISHHSKSMTGERLAVIFAGPMQTHYFQNVLTIDREGLAHRLLSSSNMPIAGAARDAMLRDAGAAFDRHASGGVATMNYVTRVYCGKLH